MDSKSLEIRSKSVEQALMPLMSQITTLVNHKKARLKRSAHARKTLQEICTRLREAILHFVRIGEEIASENPEFAADMSEACIEAKEAAIMMGSLTDLPVNSEGDTTPTDRANIIRAARALLAAVTRVLIITDMVVVKRLITAARKNVNVTSTNGKVSSKDWQELGLCLSVTHPVTVTILNSASTTKPRRFFIYNTTGNDVLRSFHKLFIKPLFQIKLVYPHAKTQLRIIQARCRLSQTASVQSPNT